jgi:CRP/FNR family cyclic AMP-dependent transcriptional regulator
MRVTGEYASVLASVPAFSGLSQQDREGFLMFAKQRTLQPGQTLFDEGAMGESLFVVLEGDLSVRFRTISAGAVTLREFARVRPGEFIGEMACIDPAPRSATVVALTQVVLAELDRSGLSVMEGHLPRVASQIVATAIHAVNARLREVDQQIAETLGTADPPAAAARPAQPLPGTKPTSVRPPPGAPPAAAPAQRAAPPAPAAAPSSNRPPPEAPPPERGERGWRGFIDALRRSL